MAGCSKWLRRLGLPALGVCGLMLTSAAPAHAQGEEMRRSRAAATAPANQRELQTGHAVWHGLERRWEALREELTRTALETALTMFFIRSSPPPPTPAPPAPPPVNPPPPAKGPNNPPPSAPPPTGQGDPPQVVNPPPQTAPEPGSIVIALVGASLAAGFAWRNRQPKQ